MKRQIFDGTCKGGPWDGERLAHWTPEYKLYTPTIGVSSRPDTLIRVLPEGHYEHLLDTWTWVPAS